jgi:hypothetical protein
MTVTSDVNFDDPDLFLSYGPIWKQCKTLYGVIDVCLDIKTDEACAVVKLVGIEIEKACVKWNRNGNNLSATIDLNNPDPIGIWKLSGIVFKIKHDIATNDGTVDMTATLYKVKGFPPKFRKDRDINEKIASW